MKNKEISQVLNKIERYEDDIYDIILRVKVNNEYVMLGYLLKAVRFDSLGKIFKTMLKKYDNYIIEIGQGAEYKSDLYFTLFFDTHNMSYLKKKEVIY